MLRLLALPVVLLAVAACASGAPSDTRTQQSPTTAPADVDQAGEAAGPLDGYERLDEYCDAVRAYLDGKVSAADGLPHSHPRVAEHLERIGTMIDASPPSHRADWDAVSDTMRKMATGDATSDEIVAGSDVLSRRILPDVTVHCDTTI